MFEQHPVPQQISSYQFRLVGDMTLKQFFQLAGGAAVGLLLYASPLPSIFKWPLIIIAVVMGAAFAFLPLQERPLSEWFAAFFRAIYGPTLFNWQKTSVKEQYFATGGNPVATTTTGAVQDASVVKLEASENKFMQGLGALLGISPTKGVAPSIVSSVPQPIPQVPSSVPGNVPVAKIAPVQKQQVQQAPAARIMEQQVVNPLPEVAPSPATPKAGTLFVATPQTPRLQVNTETRGFEPAKTQEQINAVQTSPVAPVSLPQQNPQGIAANYSAEAAPPTASTIPNILVGQVLSVDGKIVDSAIIEIKDFQGRPVRALKTNKAGHFMIVTPLPSGSYTITVEKEGLTFDPISIEVHGAIVPPLAIKSK